METNLFGRLLLSIAIVCMGLAATSCFKRPDPPKVESIVTEYQLVKRLDAMRVYRCLASAERPGDEDTSYLFIPFTCHFSDEQMLHGEAKRILDKWKSEALSFYGSEFIYSGLKYYLFYELGAGKYAEIMPVAYDWRATDIDIITLTDWDADHPAGTSVKDKFCLMFRCSDRLVTVALSDFKYGDLMFTDFFGKIDFPYVPSCNSGLVLRLTDNTSRQSFRESEMQVCLKTAFDTEYTATPSQQELTVGLNHISTIIYGY